MLTKAEAEARVAKGAAHLDTVRPGWFNEIDTGTLTLHDECGCIVGQLCGDRSFSAGVGALKMPGREDVVSRGFDVNYGEVVGAGSRVVAYQPLQDAWVNAIAVRRHPVVEDAPIEAAPALVAVSA